MVLGGGAAHERGSRAGLCGTCEVSARIESETARLYESVCLGPRDGNKVTKCSKQSVNRVDSRRWGWRSRMWLWARLNSALRALGTAPRTGGEPYGL